MPVQIVHGDLFKSSAEAWCDPVNCVGVMGAGLAKIFAERFPERCQNYRDACANGLLQPGRILVHADGRRSPPVIIHVATKGHWRRPSQIEWIAEGVEKIAETAKIMGIASIAMPALGCGRGGLAKEDVLRIVEEVFARLAPDVVVEFYLSVPKKHAGG